MLQQDSAPIAALNGRQNGQASLHWAITPDGTPRAAPNIYMPPPSTTTTHQKLRLCAFYDWAVGLGALLLVVGLSGLSFATNGALPHIVADSRSLLTIFLLGIGAAVSGFYVYLVKPGVFIPTGNLFGLAAIYSLDPLVAAWIGLLFSIAVALLTLRPDRQTFVFSVGVNALDCLVTAAVYRLLGGGPFIADFDPGLLPPLIASAVVFVVLHGALWTFLHMLRDSFSAMGNTEYIRLAAIYMTMLPVALLLAVLVAQTGPFILGLGIVVTVIGGGLIKSNGDGKGRVRRQLARVRDLNERLEQLNEYRLNLGTRINHTVDGFTILVRDYAGTSHEQEAAVIEITATVEELSRTASQIAASADQVADAAESAMTSSERGQTAISEAIAAINDVRAKVQEIASRISDLDTKAAHINNIINLSNEIADEIRMLALNATIEASGAGPYGKRFSVVANEVNALADRSRRSVTEIGQIVVEIQQATAASVRATEEGLQRMERSVALASQTDDTNHDIMSLVEHTVQAAAAISLATQQQRNASEQVVMSMHDVTRMIGQNSDKISRVSVASHDLQRIARELTTDEIA